MMSPLYKKIPFINCSRRARRLHRPLSPLQAPRFSRLPFYPLAFINRAGGLSIFPPCLSSSSSRPEELQRRRRRGRSLNLHQPWPLHHPVWTRAPTILRRRCVALVNFPSPNPRSPLGLQVPLCSSMFISASLPFP